MHMHANSAHTRTHMYTCTHVHVHTQARAHTHAPTCAHHLLRTGTAAHRELTVHRAQVAPRFNALEDGAEDSEGPRTIGLDPAEGDSVGSPAQPRPCGVAQAGLVLRQALRPGQDPCGLRLNSGSAPALPGCDARGYRAGRGPRSLQPAGPRSSPLAGERRPSRDPSPPSRQGAASAMRPGPAGAQGSAEARARPHGPGF